MFPFHSFKPLKYDLNYFWMNLNIGLSIVEIKETEAPTYIMHLL